MLPIIYDTWFRCRAGNVNGFKGTMNLNSTPCLLFLHSWGGQTLKNICVHAHTIPSLSHVSLYAYMKLLFLLQHLSPFSHDVSLSIFQNIKCPKREYFWLGNTRNFMWLLSLKDSFEKQIHSFLLSFYILLFWRFSEAKFKWIRQ